MRQRILCPAHQEKTPSCIVYEDGSAHCFACGYHAAAAGDAPPPAPKYVEDVFKTLAYITSLPRKLIRGLPLPYDAEGYYLVWPGSQAYYKLRRWEAGNGNKYRNPSGHIQPLYIFSSIEPDLPAAIVEGELNALSLAEYYAGPIVSPGSASNFYSGPRLQADLEVYRKFSRIALIVDRDKAGTQAAIELAAKLIPCGVQVKTVLMHQDCNELLCNAPGKLREFCDEVLGVSAWVRSEHRHRVQTFGAHAPEGREGGA